MTTSTTCPICRGRATRRFWTGDIASTSVVVEETIRCHCCDYEFHFEHGRYSETIGNTTFGWTYAETGDEESARESAREAAVAAERARFVAMEASL